MTNIWLISIIVTSLVACKTAGQDRRHDADRHVAKDPVTLGGVNDGNTGELTTTKNNPWFVGADSAHYCVQFGDGAGAAADQAAQKSINDQIDAAFAQWTDLLQTFRPEAPGTSHVPNGDFLAGNQVANLTRSFQRVACADDPEMRIKIGTWDKPDADFLQYTSRYTAAYALRTAYSEETGRSRGFLWLVADSGPRRYKGPAPEGAFWSQGHYVQNVVLHELGHVFGVDHLSTTFMDAGFPVGVLASKLDSAWSADDFKSQVSLDRERCGEFYRLTDDTDQVVVKDVFGVEPAAVKSLCWRAAEDRRRAEDDGTPMLFWLKGSDDAVLAEQLFFVDGVYGSTRRIGGNYLKKTVDGDYRYSNVTHMYYASLDLYRMRFERNGRQHWVDAEIMAPGFVAFRFAYSGTWKTLGSMLISKTQYDALAAALKAVSFEEDDILDD